MAKRIIMRTAEALVEGATDYLCAEPEIVLGALDGPVGQAMATLLGNQTKGHTKVFAILNSDVQVTPRDADGEQGDGERQSLHQHPYGHRAGGDRPRRARCGTGEDHPQEEGERPRHHLQRLARPRCPEGRRRSITRPSSKSTAKRR